MASPTNASPTIIKPVFIRSHWTVLRDIFPTSKMMAAHEQRASRMNDCRAEVNFFSHIVRENTCDILRTNLFVAFLRIEDMWYVSLREARSYLRKPRACIRSGARFSEWSAMKHASWTWKFGKQKKLWKIRLWLVQRRRQPTVMLFCSRLLILARDNCRYSAHARWHRIFYALKGESRIIINLNDCI